MDPYRGSLIVVGTMVVLSAVSNAGCRMIGDVADLLHLTVLTHTYHQGRVEQACTRRVVARRN